MKRRLFLPCLIGAAFLIPGCADRTPPRPVPPLEAQRNLPPWFPEDPWNKRNKAERVFYFGKVVFHTARHTIRPESAAVLQKLLEWLQANPDISRIRLEGHTDSRASDEYNQALSERRALEVANWLVDHGLDHNRILAVAFGEARPVERNDTPAGRQENRRTSFDVAEISGRRFRGIDPTNGGLVLTVLSKEEREAAKRKGKVPVYKPKPVNVERDIIKPYPPTKQPAVMKEEILETGDDPKAPKPPSEPEPETETESE